MRAILRKSGINVIGDVPWGTHFCQFYQTKEDLMDILIPYFKAGVENNEFCLWVIPKPLDYEDAKAVLTRAIPDLDTYLEKGQIAIIPQACWCLKEDILDSEKSVSNLIGKLKNALDSGYDGLRFSEDRSGFGKEGWSSFVEYEKMINNVIDNCQMIALYTYSLNKCNATEIIDVVGNHQFSLVKKEVAWERIGNSGQEKAEKAVLAKKNLERNFDAVLDPSVAQYQARAGEALRVSEERYRSIYENSLDGILLTKPDGTILSANPEASRMFCMTEDEIILAGREGVVVNDEKLAAALEERKRTGWMRAELTYRRKDGSIFTCDTTSKIFVDADGSISTSLVIRDITKRKQEEHQFRRYNRILDGINQIFSNIVQVKSEEELGEACLAIALQITDSEFGFINEMGADGLLHDVAKSELGWDQCFMYDKTGHRRPLSDFVVHGLYGSVIKNEKSFFTNDPPSHPDSIGLPYGHPLIASFLGVPLVQDGKPMGLIAVANREGGYSFEQQEDLEAIAPAVVQVLQRKRSEEALRSSYVYNLSLIEASLDPFVTIGRDGKITDVNGATEQVTGYSRNDLIGTDFSDYFTEPHKARKGYQQVFTDGEVRDYPLEIQHKDGHITPVLYNASVYKDENGEVIGVFAAARDITERKKAEEALIEGHKKLEEAYELLMENERRLSEAQRIARIGSVDWDFVTNEIHRSEEFYRIFGHSPQALPTYNEFLTCVHPDDQDFVNNAFIEAFNGKPYCIDYRIILPDGEERIIHAQGEVVFNEKHIPIRLRRTNQDITKQKIIEKELKFANHYNRSLIEASLDPLVTIGHDGKITDVNDATEQVTGYSRNDLIGTDFSDYFTEPEKARIGYQQVFTDGEVRDYLLEIQHKDGHITPVLYNASVYRDENGEVIGVFAAARDITERKKAEEALKKAHDNLENLVEERTNQLEKAYNSLKESEESLNEAQKIAHIGNWEWDIATGKTHWSDELYCIFGLNPQELTPTSDKFFSFIHPNDREYVVNAIEAALKGKPYGGIDYRIILDNEEERIVNAKSEVVFDDKNVPVRVKGIIQDITGRKKTEERIQTLANVVESSNDAIVVESLDGIITSWNKAAEQIYGYSAEEIIGKKVSLLEPDDIKGEIKSYSEKIKQGKNVQHYETLRLKKDGSIINISVTLSPIFNVSGELVALSAIVRDITERKRAEEALRESEARLRRFYESDMFGVIYFNMDGSITNANDKFLEIVGYTREDLLAGWVRLDTLTPPEYRLLDEQCIKELETTGSVKEPQEKEFIRKDGSRVPVILSATTFDPERHEGTAFAIDITERKKSEKALAEIEKLRIKEIHHRIKNNLQVISSLLDLQAEKFDNEKVREAFREGQNRVISMSLIHEELYKGSGNDTLDFSAYLRKLAENLFQTYSLSSKNISLFMDLEKDAFFGMDTAVPLGIIVNELVSNSLKHAFNEGLKGEIRIGLCREQKKKEINKSPFRLTISDNGKGIPEDIEFESLESLGLQLVSILVDQLDGEIEIKRVQGTEFKITFNVGENS